MIRHTAGIRSATAGLAGCLLLPLAACSAAAPAPTQSPATTTPSRYAVTEVIDGDTLKVDYQGGTTVRVIGIDTPETVDPDEPVGCGGPQASRAAHRLLNQKKVSLVFDNSQQRTDTYGRTLAYVRLPNGDDYGLTMIQRGHAREYTYGDSYARQNVYQAAQRRTREQARGLWSHCSS